ncbi:hypothetical protein [Streptomyces acidicola]|uniref:hypothetical protein n=1 Tax=Streptomyces acidicola TaxID=2596892 RepID=UPI0038215883
MSEHTTQHPVFDAHPHIIDPRFPLIPNDGYLPPAFTVDQYREQVGGLGVRGGAEVHAENAPSWMASPSDLIGSAAPDALKCSGSLGAPSRCRQAIPLPTRICG